MEYNHQEIEAKWQRYWAENQSYRVENESEKPKYYVLDMFPYPSGAGLHVGHPLGYIASDIISRYKRLKGFNVLHPMGFDSFGLPAEQYAIDTGQHPAVTTDKNIDTFKKQLAKIGFSYDWTREVQTSSPDFYRWTQWIFCQLFESWYNKKTDKAEKIDSLIAEFEQSGNATISAVCDEDVSVFTAERWKNYSEKQKSDILLKYRLTYLSEAVVNWCPALGTVLANDEVKDGFSERGGYPVERKKMKQWMMRITAYAERLLQGLDTIDWSEPLKEMQRNWIGKSLGAEVTFQVKDKPFDLTVFTTRVDTIFGVTYLAIAPEHELIDELTTDKQRQKVDIYVQVAKNRSERERMADVKTISGCFTGSYAINPFNNEAIPIWIADYVLAGYGTGVVMAVPSSDERDYRFAKHFDLPIRLVIEGTEEMENPCDKKWGKMINSDFLNGLEAEKAIEKAIERAEKRSFGKRRVNYRMRDAVFGRQRYWGEPIPIFYDKGVPKLLPESELPLILPEIDQYKPTETGEPPLARSKNWKYNPTQPNPTGRAYEGIANFHTTSPEKWKILKELARNNRKNPTESENILWQELRSNKLDSKIRRQHAIEDFIVDFVSINHKLVIEVDGGIHDLPENKEYDQIRTEYLNFIGYQVIRFTNDQVKNNLPNVLKNIRETLEKRAKELENQATEQPIVVGKAVQNPPAVGGGAGGAVAFPYEQTTMPGWAGSSWYWLRYMDAGNDKEFCSQKAENYWQNVDLYMGGSEHATGHLLYSRFWNKFLKDLGYVQSEEPFKKLINQGMIQGRSNLIYKIENENVFVSANFKDEYKTYELHVDVNMVENDVLDIEAFKKWRPEYANAKFVLDNGKMICGWVAEKMSKSKYNTVNPDDIIARYGADTLRMYEMFLGPLEQSKPWNTQGIDGVSRFLKKLWRLFFDEKGSLIVQKIEPSAAELKVLHKTIKKITEDLERHAFNTPISTFMIAVNELSDLKCHNELILKDLIITLSPFAPHISQELWNKLGNQGLIIDAVFPLFDEKYLVKQSFEYPIMIGGKLRTKIEFPLDMTVEEIKTQVLANEIVQKWLEGKAPKNMVVVPKKIVNVVV